MKIHPRLSLLQEFVSSPSGEHRALIRHVGECPSCRAGLEEILNQRSQALERLAGVLFWPDRTEADYSQAIEAAERQLLDHAAPLAAERAEAGARLVELMEQPSERREMLIRNHRRFQTWGLLERLIDSAREHCFRNPTAAESLAQLALSLAAVLDEDRYGAERIEDLRARAWGYVGNARRLRFELQDAEAALATAHTHLRKGTGDCLERGLFFELRASLRRDQRRFSEAEQQLLQAVRIYRLVGETHRLGRALVSLSAVEEQAGRPEQCIPLLHEALTIIDAEREPRLIWIVHHNLITALAETGRFMEAQGLLIQARPLYMRFSDPYTRNRQNWVAGRIAKGLGQVREAEAHLQAAREGFLSEEVVYEAALVSLEIAALYAEQNRTSELKEIAAEMLPIFSSQQIHREALAALSFLQRAAAAERANQELVREVAAFLKRLQIDPELSFAEPSGS